MLVEREQLDVGPEAQLCQRSALLLLPAQLVLQTGHLLHDFALNRIHARVELGAWPDGTILPHGSEPDEAGGEALWEALLHMQIVS